eukprot:c6661_g1_i1.p1 GENE.c6661_g1_i1~~c6661_g1_i1.p1  ORF type:complete len:146 (-),score=41.29 c6661_g1_i1:60-497(-)
MGYSNEQQKSLMTSQMHRTKWRDMKAEFTKVFFTKTRDEWCALAAGKDACLTPVLSIDEAAKHPHNVARRTFSAQPSTKSFPFQVNPAPRLSSMQQSNTHDNESPSLQPGLHTVQVLKEFGFSAEEIEALLKCKAGHQAQVQSKL